MSPVWLSALVVSLTGIVPSAEPGSVLTYRGQMVAVKGDADASRKTMEVTWLVTDVNNAGAAAFWAVEERGRGGWAWPDRFGKVDFDAAWKATSPVGPALLYDRGDGKSTVPLSSPFLAPPSGSLAKDSAWEHNKLNYQVVGTEKMSGREAWKVEARNSYGLRRTYWVDPSVPVVLALRERVFIGQGQEHELRLELTDVREIPDGERAVSAAGFEAMVQLRDRLGHLPQSQDTDWNDDQLKLLRSEQAAVGKLGAVALVGPVAKAAEKDIQAQKGRSGAVASLRDKVVGTVAPQLKLEGIANAGVTRESLNGKVTILHFWDYRDAPLEEPYGQIGYLDFLYRRHQKAGAINVYGVVVHEDSEEPGTRRKAIQAAGRLKNFMNLSYPLVVDDGSNLKKLGDPRVAGAKLPLFVVIDGGGKVIEYHAGNYEIQRDRGLEELEALVTKAAGLTKDAGKRE